MLQRFGEIATAREVKFAPCDLKSVEADGTFSGYASLFGAVDLGQDLVMPGAFAQSLDARGARVELNEDDKGLFARGRRSAGALRPIDRGAGRKQGGGHCLRDRHSRSWGGQALEFGTLRKGATPWLLPAFLARRGVVNDTLRNAVQAAFRRVVGAL